MYADCPPDVILSGEFPTPNKTLGFASVKIVDGINPRTIKLKFDPTCGKFP